MSVFLFIAGAFAILAGAAMAAFGMPVKEFSFGNTLILAGTVAMVGGLITIGIAMAIVQLQRVAEMLGARPLARSGRPFEAFGQTTADSRAGPGAARIPFPPKPKTGAAADKQPPAMPPEMPPAAEPQPADMTEGHVVPSLQNPDERVMAEAEADEAPLSPREIPLPPPPQIPVPPPPRFGSSASAKANADSSMLDTEAPESELRPPPEKPWRPMPASVRPAQPAYFDAMWPVEKRAAKPVPAEEPKPSSRAESIPRIARPEPKPSSSEPTKQASTSEPRAIAVLKSGVVDGMGYTLYVDGSIEAELPDGTLRFASINELRKHLENNP